MISFKHKKNKHHFLIGLITFSFIIPFVLVIIPENSSAKTISIMADSNGSQVGRSRHDSSTNGGMKSYYDSILQQYDPYGYSYYYREYFLAERFDQFNNYWNNIAGRNNQTPPNTAVYTSVKVHMVAHSSINAGYFCIGFIPAGSSWYNETAVFLDSPTETFTTTWAGHDFGIWHNSTVFPYQNNYPYNVGVDWDITSLFAWNTTLLTSPQLYLMFIEGQNHTGYIDYLGLWVEYDWAGNGNVLPTQNVQSNFSGLIWLLIIFFPAIAMAEVVPKFGFSAGIIMMLIIIGIGYTSFLPFTFLGLMAVAVSFYKGD
jgi:hypothetical protein